MIIPNKHSGNDCPILAVGLDIETTSLSDNRGLLSIGVYTEREGKVIDYYGKCKPHAGAEWSYRSSQVNGIYAHEMPFTATTYIDIDYALCDTFDEALGDIGLVEARAVGFNVDGFDMTTIKKYLPNFSRYFSHRCIELNSALLVLTNVFGVTKESITQEIEEQMGGASEAKWHDAYYDAKASYYTLREILAYKNGTL